MCASPGVCQIDSLSILAEKKFNRIIRLLNLMRRFLPWKIIHVELSKGVDALPQQKNCGGLFLVLWYRGIPLGQLIIPSEYLPKTYSQVLEMAINSITAPVGDHLFEEGFKAPLPILARMIERTRPPELTPLIETARPLETLKLRRASLDSTASHFSSLSLVICTRDRTDLLKTCLRSIEKANTRPNDIIVVDNAPTSEATYDLVKNNSWITYIRETRCGLGVARNTGLKASTGDIVAFTDDDVTIHPDWIARLKIAFKNPKILAVTGLVLPAELETRAQLLFQDAAGRAGWGYRSLLFDTNFFEQMKNRGVPVWQIGAGANMAFRREAFEILGEFDERLGAGSAGCSEDSEFWYRVLAGGRQCFYDPTAVVYHRHRSKMKNLKSQMYFYMRGHVTALLIQFEKYHHWGNLYRAFITLPFYYFKRLTKNFKNSVRTNKITLYYEISGYLSGWTYYLLTKYWQRR